MSCLVQRSSHEIKPRAPTAERGRVDSDFQNFYLSTWLWIFDVIFHDASLLSQQGMKNGVCGRTICSRVLDNFTTCGVEDGSFSSNFLSF